MKTVKKSKLFRFILLLFGLGCLLTAISNITTLVVAVSATSSADIEPMGTYSLSEFLMSFTRNSAALTASQIFGMGMTGLINLLCGVGALCALGNRCHRLLDRSCLIMIGWSVISLIVNIITQLQVFRGIYSFPEITPFLIPLLIMLALRQHERIAELEITEDAE